MKINKHATMAAPAPPSHGAKRISTSTGREARRIAIVAFTVLLMVIAFVGLEMFLTSSLSMADSQRSSGTYRPPEEKRHTVLSTQRSEHDNGLASSASAALYADVVIVVHCDDLSELAFNFDMFPSGVALFSNCVQPRRLIHPNQSLRLDAPSSPLTSFVEAVSFLERAAHAADELNRSFLLVLSNGVSTHETNFRQVMDKMATDLKMSEAGTHAGVTCRVVDGDQIVMDGLVLVETSSSPSGTKGRTMAPVKGGRPVQDTTATFLKGKGVVQPHPLASAVGRRTLEEHVRRLRSSAPPHDEVRLAPMSVMLTLFMASLPLQSVVRSDGATVSMRHRSPLRNTLLPVLQWIAGDFYDEAPPRTIVADGAKLRELVLSVLPVSADRGSRRTSSASVLDDVIVQWDPYCGCTGINIEAINFIVPLEEAMHVRAVASPDCWCRGFCSSDVAALRRAQQPKSLEGLKSVWVSHKPVDAFPSFPYSGAIHFPSRPNFVVGRTMIETDRISPSWVSKLNTPGAVDELWVPSQFLLDAFYMSGVRRSLPMFVVPEAIDVEVYNARRFSESQRQAARHALLLEANLDTSTSAADFVFLSNFKWEPRKGWDVLLRAYFSTFTNRDRVVLLIKTYLYLDPAPRDVNRLREKVRRFAQANGFQTEALPRIGFLMSETDAAEMPAMYNAADGFVLPTRGEGWGLPLQEAMAMGLPTIGTNWGGNTDFMNESNSFLIDVDGFLSEQELQAGISRQLPFTALRAREETGDESAARRTPYFAEPSARHLGQLMKYVVEHRNSEAAERAAQGAAFMRQRFSRQAVREVVLERLSAIRGKL